MPYSLARAMVADYYRKAKPKDDAQAIWMACYCVDRYAATKAMAKARDEYTKNVLPDGEDEPGLILLDKKFYNKSDTNIKYCDLVHQLCATDNMFDDLTQDEIMDSETDLVELLIMARKNQVEFWDIMEDAAALQKAITHAKGWEWAPDEDSEVEEVFEVLKVLDKRTSMSGVEYYLQWMPREGETVGEKSWEPADGCTEIPTLIQEFEEGRATVPAKKVRRMREAASARQVAEEPTAEASMSGVERNLVMLSGIAEALLQSQADAKSALDKTTAAAAAAKKPSLVDEVLSNRPILKGDERVKKIGIDMFKEERRMKRGREYGKMQPHLAFAETFNAMLDKLMKVEKAMFVVKLDIMAYAEKGMTEGAAVVKLQAKKELLDEKFVAIDDKLEMLRQCSEWAEKGGSNVATADKLWQIVEEGDADVTDMDKEFTKKRKAAEALLKDKAARDQAMLVAQRLGTTAADGTGVGTKSYAYPSGQHGGGFSVHTVTTPQYFASAGVAPPMLPMGSPPLGTPSMGMPLPMQGAPLVGQQQQQQQQQTTGKLGAQQQTRSEFQLADTVLGGRCPAHLKGVMVPLNAFFGRNKLSQAPKQRQSPFPFACKQCGTIGHEAWECETTFQVNGKPAKSSRQLYLMKPKVVDEMGMFI